VRGADALENLRVCTRDVHERLHVHPLLSSLVTPELTKDNYIWALLSFERFYQNLCDQFDFELAHKKLELISEDISALGKRNPLPACTYLNIGKTPDHALGTQYVVIGSALGGAMISKNVENMLCLKSGAGNSYFGSSAATAKAYWKNFQEGLAQNCTNITICSEAAQHTFEGLEKWLWSAHSYQERMIKNENAA
jgi:heme oxygenase